MTIITFSIKYLHGDADKGRLDMYDAAVSFQGFAKAISITTHALLNDGEIRHKGHGFKGGDIYIRPSKKGSFEQVITLIIDNPAASALAVSVATATFYDMLKWTWLKTLSKFHAPETTRIKALEKKTDDFIDRMEVALESALEQAHRPIKNNPHMTITIKRPKSGSVIVLDAETLKSVSIQTETNVTKGIIGNVTRYNMLTGYGRFYDDALRRTVSFNVLDNVPTDQKQILPWSLYYAQEKEGEGKIMLDAKRILTAKEVLKRYVVSKVQHIDS